MKNQRFQLRFPAREIEKLALRYTAELNERDRGLTAEITDNVFPAYQRQGFLDFDQFVTVCKWKSPRAKPHFEANEPEMVREVSALVRTTKSERIRIQAWTLLSGVKWPTASVFLHFAFPNKYPILDVRALDSLGFDKPPRYDFAFWNRYVDACRSIAAKADVTMRQLDQALWKYSQINQKLGCR